MLARAQPVSVTELLHMFRMPPPLSPLAVFSDTVLPETAIQLFCSLSMAPPPLPAQLLDNLLPEMVIQL